MDTKKEKLLILGAGGHGKVIADSARCMGCYTEIAFLDDVRPESGWKYPYYGVIKDYDKYIESHDIIVAIGNSKIRQGILEELIEKGADIPIIVHPQAVIAQNVTMGKGTVVMAGAVINTDVCIGKGVIVNTSCSIDHDCVIGDYAHIAVGAHLCGIVHIGEHTWVGAGATIIQTVSVCGECVLGAGTVVVKDIVSQGTYIGVPARKIVKL